MPNRVLRAAASAPLPPVEAVFSDLMARIQRQARTSGVSTEALGLAIADRLSSWFPPSDRIAEAAMSAMRREATLQ